MGPYSEIVAGGGSAQELNTRNKELFDISSSLQVGAKRA